MKKLFFILIIILLLSAIILPQVDSLSTFRFLTYNIHHGEGIDSVVDIERIAQIIIDNKIDIAALQEVDRGVKRTNKIDIPGLIAEKTGMDNSFYKNIDYQEGEYGNCILSRFPIISDTNFHYSMIRIGEQRGLLQTVINFRGIHIAVLNTHLDYRADDSERISNVLEIFKIMENYAGVPTIIAGDFNDVPESRTHLKLKKKFIDVWEYLNEEPGFTYPTEDPNKRIDFIYFVNPDDKSVEAKIIPVKIYILNSIASDHLPVIAEFELSKRNK